MSLSTTSTDNSEVIRMLLDSGGAKQLSRLQLHPTEESPLLMIEKNYAHDKRFHPSIKNHLHSPTSVYRSPVSNTIGVTHSYGRKGKGGDGHVGMNFGRGTRIKDDARKQQSLVSSLKYFSDFDKLRLRREVTIELGIASTGPK
mmetsp:Transcript_9146/g.13651  ORF Transcript_9146/g.13651 Transcript_9146/m.13651 type:complete len:144 (+) Transcript_9146:580-1011(+)